MKHKGKWVASFTVIIVAVFAFWNDRLFGHEQPVWHYLLFLIIVPSVVWLGMEYDRVRSRFDAMKKEKEMVEEEAKEKVNLLNQRIKDQDDIHASTQGGIFSFNRLNEEVYFSKGIGQIYGYSDEELKNNFNLWKEAIHPDDVEKVHQDEKILSSGASTKIEYRILHPEQGVKWVVKTATPFISPDGTLLKINGQIIEITERKQLENELKQMAYYDDLTDLPNRKLLDRHIEKALARSKRHHHNFTIMFIDLDDFKIVNDTMGHEAGDILLKEVAARLNQTIREEDLIARIGGDEFIVVLEETNQEEIEDIAQRVVENVALPYIINDKEAKISLSIGISMYPDDGEDKETLIEHADQAMYFAKNRGKNNFKIYTPDLSEMELKKVGFFERLLSKISF